MSNEKNKIDEKDILEFFKYSYFGNLKDPIEAASNRAYRDMCRTIRFGNFQGDRVELKKEVNSFLYKQIKKFVNDSITSQEKFDSWHCKVCKNIKLLYNEKGINFTYGQAQKWLNMTIKYLYMLEDEEYSFDCVFEYLHIPIDNYIFVAVKKELRIDRPNNPWSKLDETEYLKYQKAIREELKKRKYSPLLWEFDKWLEVAKGNNKK